MSLTLLAAAALSLFQPSESPRPEPEMRIAIADLDFDRAADIDEFRRRVRSASQDFCERHLAVVTPENSDPLICRAELRRLAYRALPAARREQLASARRFYAFR